MHADLIFLCHASTAATRSASFPDDDPLDADGSGRAARVSLPDAGRVVRAPGVAAGQTAAALGLPADVDHALRACDFGRWAGRSLAAVSEEEPVAFAAWMADPQAAPHGGEAMHDVLARVGAWVDGRLAGAGRTVAITDATVVRAALVHVLGAGAGSFRHIDVAPLAQLWLRSDGHRWVLRRLAP